MGLSRLPGVRTEVSVAQRSVDADTGRRRPPGQDKGRVVSSENTHLAILPRASEQQDHRANQDTASKHGRSLRGDAPQGRLPSDEQGEYFSGFDSTREQLVFLDPDNGFEPEKSCDDKHVSYRDIATLVGQLSGTSIVSVFHHFRRVSFPDDFARIRARLGSTCYSTAIYWHSLMFVAVGKSEQSMEAVIAANKRYARDRPVKVIT